MNININELCYISKILKIESNSQLASFPPVWEPCCVISQRYSKLKAIHNYLGNGVRFWIVVLYLKDTQNWKQFTTQFLNSLNRSLLCYISKILKIESNSQLHKFIFAYCWSCVISQRYSKLKAIHNGIRLGHQTPEVVLYLKDTQNWKQFTTNYMNVSLLKLLCYISKILKIESNSQHFFNYSESKSSCVISQRYSKLKAIHNRMEARGRGKPVVLYLKDTQNWKQFTTFKRFTLQITELCYISKILKIESNSQRVSFKLSSFKCCVISQRYSKLKAIHNLPEINV